jgi:hypothetical protein
MLKTFLLVSLTLLVLIPIQVSAQIVGAILIMTSGTGISSSRAFAQNDSETDLDNLTLTNTSEMQVDTTLTNGSVDGLEGLLNQP